MRRKAECWVALVLSVIMLASGGAVFAGQSAVSEYKFDKSKTATEQLDEMFTTIDIMDATIEQLRNEMEAGNVTSEQLTQMYIDRIKAYDRKLKLNSIISICPDALDQAKKLDEERAKGNVRGPLHGIPIVVKDNIDSAGIVTSGGSLALAHMVVSKDSFVVRKLKDAGAVIIAKANLSEFAYSAIDSESLLGGTVHNAYDASRTPAGSSGGTGVAVTSNFAAAGLGTDTGGSIRNPSSYSNLYGIRPSKGLTSINGVIPIAGQRDTVGPMTRTAEDMAQVLEVIAGTDENDDFTQEADADRLVGAGYMGSLSADGLKGKRIGYLKSSFAYISSEGDGGQSQGGSEGGQGDGCQSQGGSEGGQGDGGQSQGGSDGGQGDGGQSQGGSDGGDDPFPEIKLPSERIDAMVKRTRADLRRAGAEFVDLSSYLDDETVYNMYMAASDNTAEYDFNKYLFEKGDEAPYKTLKALYKSGKVGIYHTGLPVIPEEVEDMADSFEETKKPYDTEIGGFLRPATWQQTVDYRKQMMDIMEEHDIDAVMYIATLDVPPRYAYLLEQFDVNNMGWGYGFTFGPALGLPEVVIPMGFSDADDKVQVELPLGMRLFGKFGDEKNLMEMAYAYEKQAGPSIRRMPADSPALEDQNLAAFLEALMDEVYSIDYDLYNSKPEGKVKLMQQAYSSAAGVDTEDPYATYKASVRLAKAYDRVMSALKESGVKKLKTSFTVKASPKKVKAKASKKQTVKIKVTKLTKGAPKPAFSIRRVTNSQKSKVKIDKKTGKVTVKKNMKKCKITVQAVSKANSRYAGLTKSVTITVK